MPDTRAPTPDTLSRTTTELAELGYQTAFREDGWTECLVSGHGERWPGTGLSRREALEDAVRKMFPSHAARTARDRPYAPSPAEPPVPYMPTPKANEIPIRNLAAPLDDIFPESGAVAETPAEELAEPGMVDASTGDVVSTEEAVSFLSDDQPVVHFGTESYVSPDDEDDEDREEDEAPKITREDALEMVASIDEEITDSAEDVAVMSCLQQRLHIGLWIFRARAVQETLPTDTVVEEAVHQVALRLTALCKIYWPGSVRALQIYTIPSQGLEGLVPTPKTPLTWAESADITHAYLEQIENSHGVDEYGWKDRAQCVPAPPNPASVMLEIVQMVEPVLGPIGQPLDEKMRQVPAERIIEDMETLVAAAYLLRWIRRSCPTSEMWGKVMGALRWASRQPRDTSETQELRDVLHQDRRPSKSWAELLGRDPKVNRRKQMQRQVMERLPAEDWSREDLVSWLGSAFGAFNNPQIAKLVGTQVERVLDLGHEDFADAERSVRSRLRKLQSILRQQSDVSDVQLPDVGDGPDAEDEQEDDKRPNVDPTAELLGRVREMTEGKRILFVTNRDDTRLQKDLEEDLRCSVTLKDGGDLRRMASIVNSVDATRYDLVLMATSFNNHRADLTLCRAAKAEGLPYIRVQKGRRGATLRALARAFNLSGERKQDDEATVAQAG